MVMVRFADKKFSAKTDVVPSRVTRSQRTRRTTTSLRKQYVDVIPVKKHNGKLQSKKLPVKVEDTDMLLMPPPKKISRPRQLKNSAEKPDTNPLNKRLLMPPPKKISRPRQLKNSADKPDTKALNKTYGFMRLSSKAFTLIRHLLFKGYTIHFLSVDPADLNNYEETLVQFAAGAAGSLKFFETCEEFVKSTEIFLMYTEEADDMEQARTVLNIDNADDNMLCGKSYIEMTTMDFYASIKHHDVLEKKNVAYLEVQLNGNNWDFLNGNVLALCSGDKHLFSILRDGIFKLLCKSCFYLDDIGKASRANATLQLIRTNLLCGYTEVMALANRLGIGPQTFTNIIAMTELNTAFLYNKGQMIIDGKYSENVEDSVKSLHKDARIGLEISDRVKIDVPLAAKSIQILKQARFLGYHDEDVAAVYATINDY